MKKLLALLLAVMMVLSLAACGTSDAQQGTTTQATTEETTEATTQETAEETTEATTQASLMKITVTVVHADGTSKEFTYETDEEYLGPVLVAEGLIKGEEGPYGLTITQVDGESAVYETDKAYWALYEGEEYALQGIDTTPVADGATYKLVYTGA